MTVSVNAFYDREGGVWKFEGKQLPAGAKLICQISEIRAARLNRNGDMGADPADAFEAPLHPRQLKTFTIDLAGGPVFAECTADDLLAVSSPKGREDYTAADAARARIAGRLKIHTPDPFINTLGGTIAMAADGIWDGKVWQHGAVGWRMPLPGWRAAYVGDALGWHDRATIHFDNYAVT